MGTVCSRNSTQVTAEELALKYLEEDEEYQQQQNEIEERQERQREAIKHVMTYFYPYSNINTRIAKHPKGSPKAGQKYMWITRGGRRSFSEPREANYPECVTVDRNGDVYVTEHTDKDTYCITSREIFAANDVPIRPEPPFLSGCGQNNLAVEWVPILARVDRYELHYQAADSVGSSAGTWKCISAFLFTNCGTLKDARCNKAYLFRVRAHNMVGWSDWSHTSQPLRTASGPPERPDAPTVTDATEFTMDLEWNPCDNNGSDIFCYTVRIKAEGAGQEWKDAFVGLKCACRIDGLDDSTPYFIQIFATNDIGRSEGSYAIQAKTREAPLDVSGPVLRRCGLWEEYFDTRRQRCVYLNTRTGLRQKKTPFALREDAISVSDPNVEFRKKRYRFIRAIRRRAVQLERRQSRSIYAMTDEDFAAACDRGHPAANEPVSPTIVAVMALTVERERIFEDTYEQFMQIQKHQLSRRTRVEFTGEVGIDSGGLTKEWYLELARSFYDKDRRLFRRVANGASMGIDPRSAKLKNGGVPEFRFIGRIFGKAVFDRQLMDFPLGMSLAKALLGLPPTMEDLQTADPVYAKSLQWMLDNDIDGVIDETFSAFRVMPGGKEECYDLVVDGVPFQGGRNTDVTNENKHDYVKGMIHFTLVGQFKYQMDAFCSGFYEVVPKEDVAVFGPDELLQLLNGQDEIVVAVLASTSMYEGHGFDADSVLAKWLWEVVENMDKEGRTALLKFVTGCPRIPLDGFDPQFTVVCSDNMEATALPRSHTCFNQLVLPPYHLAYPGDKSGKGKDLLREKLGFALEHGAGFHLT